MTRVFPTVQAFEAMYRWHEGYPLGSNPLAKLSASVVLGKLRQFAKDYHVYEATSFSSEVLSTTIEEDKDRQALAFSNFMYSKSLCCCNLPLAIRAAVPDATGTMHNIGNLSVGK